MLFRASEGLAATRRTRDRTSGAVLALSVQTLFVLLIVFSSSRLAPPRSPAHETILLLHPLPQTAPRNIDARGTVLHLAPPLAMPVLPNIAPPVLAPPSGIAGFGRALFGCAPEHYADLPPDEKAHCPKPGEGMAINQPPDLLNPPKSHAKDEALWQEQWAEDHWVPPVCPPSETPVGFCVMHQAMAENRRAQVARQKIADDKAGQLQGPKRPLPNIGVRRN